ncbi:MAG TPA: glycoside hydrolase family 30 beta sandwich domain-containing protein [Chryseolinea sp.]|nr:glycoside hydrolase family 30 beta sandwich domain-containing protein [Chryseolinea sp.]HPM32313.1 glycoside hydrolase family 30 beta sandwich domain-containing protein [Chryseolinea sp.]
MELKMIYNINMAKRILSALCVLFIVSLFSCGGDPEPTPPPPPPPPVVAGNTITVNPADLKQEMVGFGGALTWYCNWVTNNNKKQEIADLMFDDLGIDIIRFKNWYYPGNYPTNKSTADMPDVDNDYAKSHWDATNELYDLAMARNPNIKILLSSWGPPTVLKSNSKLQEGTLKKDGSGYMYDEFADYWVDVLDNVPFDPDYISIQNEPTFSTSGWTTCKWEINETASLAGYNTAFNKVYDKIKDRTHVPVMLGPESQDVSTFVSFANVLKDNPNCPMYAFHPYNINSGTAASTVTSSLKSVGNFTKPNMMTEFSDNLTDWYSNALFIHKTLVDANSSGYIYWKLSWSTPASGEDAAMISVGSGAATPYKVTPYYHLIKHFSKHIDAGHHRVAATSSNGSIFTSAFISPDNSKLTLVIINDKTTAESVKINVTGKTATAINVFQSKTGSFYKTVTVSSPADAVSLPSKSITTVVLDI